MLRGAERVELLTFFPLDVATQPREPCWGVCVQSLGLSLGYAAVLVILSFEGQRPLLKRCLPHVGLLRTFLRPFLSGIIL